MSSELPPQPQGDAGDRPAAPRGPRPSYGGRSSYGDRDRGDRGDRGGPGGRRPRHRVCSFCVEKVQRIDYKDVGRIRRYISERGKIDPRRKSGTCAKHQRMLTGALKRAGPEFGVERHGFAEQSRVRRRRLSHHRMVGLLEPRRALHFREEPVGLFVEAAELPPFGDDDEPGDQGGDRSDNEDDFGLGTGDENQVQGGARNGGRALQHQLASSRNQVTSSLSPCSNGCCGRQPSTRSALPIARPRSAISIARRPRLITSSLVAAAN